VIDPEQLLNLPVPDVRQSYGPRECVLYALSLGLGDDPLDPGQLAFAMEESGQVLPTMITTLAHPGFWSRDLPTGITHSKVVHGEEAMELHAPLPASGDLVARCRIVEVVDKGPGRGALVRMQRRLFDSVTNSLIATIVSSSFCRADGGFGGAAGASSATWTRPARAPDHSVRIRTLPQAALIYRLNGDTNLLHVDPAFAGRAGFPRPILHGLATFGLAGRAILSGLCSWQPAGLQALSARFNAPLFPGETVQFDLWADGDALLFEGQSLDRQVAVLSHGRARIDVRPGGSQLSAQ